MNENHLPHVKLNVYLQILIYLE